jgi:hypothetical protein
MDVRVSLAREPALNASRRAPRKPAVAICEAHGVRYQNGSFTARMKRVLRTLGDLSARTAA